MPRPDAHLDLSSLPPIFVSATHFSGDELHELEDDLTHAGAQLTYDVTEAGIVLSQVRKKPRILLDLRAKGLEVKTEGDDVGVHAAAPVASPTPTPTPGKNASPGSMQRKIAGIGVKRKRGHDTAGDENAGRSSASAITIDDSSTESESDAQPRVTTPATEVALPTPKSTAPAPTASTTEASWHPLRVVHVDWFTNSTTQGRALPLDEFTTISEILVRKMPPTAAPRTPLPSTPSHIVRSPGIRTPTYNSGSAILARAKEDASSPSHHSYAHRSWAGGHSSSKPTNNSTTTTSYAHLLHQTTTEHDLGSSSDLPPPPSWVTNHIRYSCQRSTPSTSPNTTFISLLKEIQSARLLTDDAIGVRAYATSIAALSAYPYKLTSPREVLSLPGCDVKIANLFVEFANTGTLRSVEELRADEDLKILKLFYNIWGVGATTAREFYYDKGWRDLDDIVEYEWKTLSRVQQIGVKYYDEFLDLIPRSEVEDICKIIHRHAVRVRDDGIQSMIVGGYRRGKQACGDVDVIISHPDEKQTLNLVSDIVTSLEEEEWITHTLLLSLNNTARDQKTLPFVGNRKGGGFDTLDKALVVWQDPEWEGKERDLREGRKNPNIHRRVDIIIAPWRTVGCAVVGWQTLMSITRSGGTTFERDLRSYARNVKGWKFDSSGVRDRSNGEIVDLEGFFPGQDNEYKERAKTMEEAEKRVFKGMGLEYREPWERVTG